MGHVGWLETGDQIASVVAGIVALVTAVLGVCLFVLRRRREKAESEEAEAKAFVIRMKTPSPEEAFNFQRYDRNQRKDYYGVSEGRNSEVVQTWIALLVLLVLTFSFAFWYFSD